jgi:S-adenosylmethionine/arginine decarboxylase-like enzyme
MTATLTVDGIHSPMPQARPPHATEAALFVPGNPSSSQDWSWLVERTGAFARAVARAVAWLLLQLVAHVYRTLRSSRRRHSLHCQANRLHATALRRPPAVPGTRAHGGRTHVPWGMLAAIDLHGCERSRLEDPDTLRAFVPSLIDAIGMRAHGPLALDRFGDGELQGWSALQFIETSSITVHADEVSGRCFVDIFSCRPFDADAAAAIAVAHFGGTLTLTVLHR